jgi:hypothetical protein
MVLLHITEEIVDGIIDLHGDYLQSAKKLNLSSNGIRLIDDLAKLNVFLTKLDLSFNDLEEVKGLQSLTLLEELNLSGNRLTDVTHIQHMTSLKHLDLSQNNITQLRDIQMLDKLQNLRSLNLAGNPLCTSALLYPCAVLAALPSLEVMDNRLRPSLSASIIACLCKLPLSYPHSFFNSCLLFGILLCHLHIIVYFMLHECRSRAEHMLRARNTTAGQPSLPPAPPQLSQLHSLPESSSERVSAPPVEHPTSIRSTASPSPASQAASISTSHAANLQQQLAYAQAEIAAYADMFRVAENSLGREAPKEVLSTADTRASRPNIESILAYPYADLLKLWRQKVSESRPKSHNSV